MASSDPIPPSPAARPLSPHLGIYRFTLTMAMSIAHRITGAGLYSACCCSPGSCSPPRATPRRSRYFSGFIQSIIGRLILFGFTWALFHHLLGGAPAPDLDAGYGMDDPEREQLALGDADRRPRADARRLGRSARVALRERRDERIRQVPAQRRSAASAISARRAAGRRTPGWIHVTARR